tara:strand:- start:341 stop:685 length:345 start_codon:yes stop_codon:yes gene_type:complete
MDLFNINDLGNLNTDNYEESLYKKLNYITIGRSQCDFTTRQMLYNNEKKNVQTLLCGDSTVISTMSDEYKKICDSLNKINLQGVPANFTCLDTLDLSKCSIQYGLDKSFGSKSK